jgi:NMD protein affecting ribosome stability and mRNA decay
MINECDVCGKKTNKLVDYYAMLCEDCKREHTDMVLIRRIGELMNKIEGMK